MFLSKEYCVFLLISFPFHRYRYSLKNCMGRMGCIKLENLCVCFAGFNMILKTILIATAFASSNNTIVSLVSLGPSSNEHRFEDYYTYDERFISLMRIILVVDCSLSIIYSVVLIIGVRKNSIRLLKSCLFYGTVILFLSSAASLPRFGQMIIANDYEFVGRRVEAFVLTIICAIQVLVVYKTYKKFEKTEDLQQLIQKRSEQRKKQEEFIVVDTAM